MTPPGRLPSQTTPIACPMPLGGMQGSGDQPACSISQRWKLSSRRPCHAPEALREATAKAAAEQGPQARHPALQGREAQSKRMAELGTVYDITPVPRAPGDILVHGDGPEGRAPAPRAANKWCTASVADDAAVVIAQCLDEARRREPDHKRAWVALVDGNKHQIDTFAAQAKAHGIEVPSWSTSSMWPSTCGARRGPPL